ncbi:MAG: amino acid permease [Rickettsiales bacterium]|nr:amino acid permease [Rickettsiales bacterium]
MNSIFRAKIFRTKSIESIIEGAKKNSLKKTLGSIDLILFGIGCTIGTGIFVLTGIAAAQYAGPAIAISYVLAGLACMFAALAYTELAAMVPVAGSAYTYSYAILGEFVAWLVAWGLILEYTVAASTVAAGWSGYFIGILKSGDIIIPEALTKVPSDGGIINLPAVCVAFFVGTLLTFGTKESVMVNRILVAIKLGVIFLFLIIAAPHIKMENYTNFMPYGWHGVGAGAAAIFFAYLGFDAVATTAEECKNPNRDLPIGIIGGLTICAILYVLVSLTLTGIVNYTELNNPEPMAFALRANGSTIGSALVGTGAVAGMLAVLLVLMYGQSRVFFVMARDGLMPSAFCKLHPKFATPYLGCISVTIAVMVISGFTPIHTMGNMSSLGILFAFVVVAFGVLVLRLKRPELHRPFKCPAVFLVAPIAIISCGYLMYNLLLKTGVPFLTWFTLGTIVYALYGYRKSYLNK